TSHDNMNNNHQMSDVSSYSYPYSPIFIVGTISKHPLINRNKSESITVRDRSGVSMRSTTRCCMMTASTSRILPKYSRYPIGKPITAIKNAVSSAILDMVPLGLNKSECTGSAITMIPAIMNTQPSADKYTSMPPTKTPAFTIAGIAWCDLTDRHLEQ